VDRTTAQTAALVNAKLFTDYQHFNFQKNEKQNVKKQDYKVDKIRNANNLRWCRVDKNRLLRGRQNVHHLGLIPFS